MTDWNSTPCRRFGRRVEQTGDQLGRLDVDRVLIAKRPALHAVDEPAVLHVLRQVGECEDRDDSSEDRECLRQHCARETPPAVPPLGLAVLALVLALRGWWATR